LAKNALPETGNRKQETASREPGMKPDAYFIPGFPFPVRCLLFSVHRDDHPTLPPRESGGLRKMAKL
jgi:hypothetical protein